MMDDALPRLVTAHPAVFRGINPGQFLPAGWYELVDKLVTDLEQLLGDDVAALTVNEVKSKFGSLRFYVTLELPELPGEPLPATVREHAGGWSVQRQSPDPRRRAIDELIAQVGLDSEKTCETCALPGEQFADGGYLYVACGQHTLPGSVTAADYLARKRRKSR